MATDPGAAAIAAAERQQAETKRQAEKETAAVNAQIARDKPAAARDRAYVWRSLGAGERSVKRHAQHGARYVFNTLRSRERSKETEGAGAGDETAAPAAVETAGVV